jgi:diaminopimelate epimerase
MSRLSFFKGHGLGNDYLAVAADELPFELTPPAVRLICDRHTGYGSDGILVRVHPDSADFGLRIFNPDGTEAEKSGNGLRIFAAFLLEIGAVDERARFTVDTPGGQVAMEILERSDDGVLLVEVEMGTASFRSSAVGLAGPDRDVQGEVLELESGEQVAIHTVSMGNPHCVCFQDELIFEELRRRGPQISSHPWFAHGTNVQFARVAGPAEMEAFIWERGAGETLASGSSACAVAAAAVRNGLVQQREVTVRMPGGTLQISIGVSWDVVMRGPVESVYNAEATPDFRRRIEALT